MAKEKLNVKAAKETILSAFYNVNGQMR